MNRVIFRGMIDEDQETKDQDSPNRSRRGGTLFSAGTLRARILACVSFVGAWTVVACGLAQPTASDTQIVSVRLAELPGPWSNLLADHPLLKAVFVRHTVTVEEAVAEQAVVVTMRLKRSTDSPLPVAAAWHQDVPLDELALRVSNLGSTEVGVSLRLVTADQQLISTPAKRLAAGETRWLDWDMLDTEPAQVPGARAVAGQVLLVLQQLRAGTDYRVAFHDLECRGVPASPAVSIEPVIVRTAPERSVQFFWKPAPGALTCGSAPVALTLERSGKVFLRAQTSLEAAGDTVALSPVQLQLPHGLPAGTYAVTADTRRVPIQGQSPRRAQVGTLEVESTPSPQPVKATVEPYRGAPAVHIAGRPVSGLKYMTYRLDERYVQQFATTGVQVVDFGCGCGEHPYGLAADTWLAPDQFDFSEVDARVVRVLSAHPQALLLPRIYVAAPCVSAAVLRALAKSAGVHVYVDEDAVVYANASLLSITVVEPGRRRILLPQPVNVVDAISGQRVAEQTTSCECDFQERESRLFLLDSEF